MLSLLLRLPKLRIVNKHNLNQQVELDLYTYRFYSLHPELLSPRQTHGTILGLKNRVLPCIIFGIYLHQIKILLEYFT